jgi:hypothetical protein
VARVEAGELKPNVDHNKNLIALGDREPNVSAGGNDIVVDEPTKAPSAVSDLARPEALFHGFLRVPPAAIPKNSSSSRTSRRASSSATTRTGTSWRTRLLARNARPADRASAMPPMISVIARNSDGSSGSFSITVALDSEHGVAAGTARS